MERREWRQEQALLGTSRPVSRAKQAVESYDGRLRSSSRSSGGVGDTCLYQSVRSTSEKLAR